MFLREASGMPSVRRRLQRPAKRNSRLSTQVYTPIGRDEVAEPENRVFFLQERRPAGRTVICKKGSVPIAEMTPILSRRIPGNVNDQALSWYATCVRSGPRTRGGPFLSLSILTIGASRGASAMPSYHPQRIEPKWQTYWEQNKTFRAGDLVA